MAAPAQTVCVRRAPLESQLILTGEHASLQERPKLWPKHAGFLGPPAILTGEGIVKVSATQPPHC